MARKEATKTDDQVLETMDDAPTTQEVATTTDGTMELGAVQGDVSPEDIYLPRLQMAYGVGKLSENFAPGDFVLGEDNLLCHKGEELRIIFLHVNQYWKERLTNDEYQAGLTPRTFATEKEVIAEGETTRWIGNQGPKFNKALGMKMLIEKPDDLVCGMFGVPIAGKEWAPAQWDIDKSAYTRVSRVLLPAAQFSLKARGLLSATFSLSSRTDRMGQNMVPVPILKLAEHNTDEVIAEIKAAFGQ